MKSETKKVNKTKSKSKIIILIVLVIFAIFFVVTKAIESNIAKSVENFVVAFKARDNETAKQYVSEETVSFLNLEEIPQTEELMKMFLENLSFDVMKVSKKGDEAIVKVRFYNKDFEKIMSNYMQKVVELSIAMDEMSVTEEEIETQLIGYLKEEFSSEENQIIESIVDVKLVKIDKVWKIVVEDNFRNAMFPGLSKIVESLNPVEQ